MKLEGHFTVHLFRNNGIVEGITKSFPSFIVRLP